MGKTGTKERYGVFKPIKVDHNLKEFIAWDGEGEHAKNTKGKYLLFGASTGDDIGAPSDRGLRASECFQLMIEIAQENPDAIHVAFAFNYDVSMIVESLPLPVKEKIAKGQTVWWKQYRIENLTRKWFKLYDKNKKISITIYDIFTFFGCSALQAWKEYLPDESDLDIVIAGKGSRSIFTHSDMPFLREYMHRELQLYVKLIDKLRMLLLVLDVKPRGWYGPGAAASAFLSQHKIKDHMSRDLPDEVIQAAQYAYFGGRFEQYRAGIYYGTVFKSDIRSAYPHALRTLPSLTHGEWIHNIVGTNRREYILEDIREFSLYKVSYRGYGDKDTLGFHNVISPFPFRDFRGLINYPREVDGWYWGVEVKAAIKHAQPGEVVIDEAWEFVETEDHVRPFAFIEPIFAQRAQWKRDGNPVQLAAKLCLNSIYGKLAQRIGWNQEKGEPPTWHQLEYSGYATAYCRAMVYDAMATNPESIIAVETDGIFSTEPLDLPEDNKQLGDWEVETYDGIAYVQSGVYVLCELGCLWRGRKMRGFSRGDFSVSDVLAKSELLIDIDATTHRFAALKAYWNDNRHTTWIDNTHTLVWGGGGKRAHDSGLCRTCISSDDAIRDGLHDCYITSAGGHSEKHTLPWREDNRDRMIHDVNTLLLSDPGMWAHTAHEVGADTRRKSVVFRMRNAVQSRKQRKITNAKAKATRGSEPIDVA